MSIKKSNITRKTNTKKPTTRVTKSAATRTTRIARATRTPKTIKTIRTVRRGKKCAVPNKPVALITIIILGVAGLILASCLMIYTVIGSQKSDAARFAAEYSNVAKDNPFVYRTGDEIVDILEHGTGVVFLGFPSCPWCQAYAGYLSEVAIDKGLDKIYYYNIEQDRADNTELYQKLVSILSSYLQFNEEGKRRIYVPNTTFVVDGKIIGNDLESSKYTADETEPEKYWTEERVEDLKNRLGVLISEVQDSAKGCEDTCDK